MIHVAARPRAPVLARFVRSFHYHEDELGPGVERILPTGQAHLMINLEEDEFRTYTGPNCEKTIATVVQACQAHTGNPLPSTRGNGVGLSPWNSQ